jgi:hypothetical protein
MATEVKRIITDLWENLAQSDSAPLDLERLITGVERCAEALEQIAEAREVPERGESTATNLTGGFMARVHNWMARNPQQTFRQAVTAVQVEMNQEQRIAVESVIRQNVCHAAAERARRLVRVLHPTLGDPISPNVKVEAQAAEQVWNTQQVERGHRAPEDGPEGPEEPPE